MASKPAGQVDGGLILWVDLDDDADRFKRFCMASKPFECKCPPVGRFEVGAIVLCGKRKIGVGIKRVGVLCV